MGFNIDQFTSQLSGKGVSRASLFEARIFFPNTLIIDGRFAGGLDPELTYRADSASIPGRSAQTIDDARDATGPMRKLGYTPIYSPIDITFICDEGLQIKEKMESWMDIIAGNHRVAPNGELNDTKVFNPGYYSDYIGTIQILKLNERGTLVTTTELIEAYPLNISLMALSWDSQELQKLQVQFQYRYYRELQPSPDTRKINVSDRNFGSFGPVPEVPTDGTRGLPSNF